VTSSESQDDIQFTNTTTEKVFNTELSVLTHEQVVKLNLMDTKIFEKVNLDADEVSFCGEKKSLREVLKSEESAENLLQAETDIYSVEQSEHNVTQT